MPCRNGLCHESKRKESIDPDGLMDGFSRDDEGSDVILSLRPSLHAKRYQCCRGDVIVLC